MNDKLKFFDETFRILLAIAVCVWIIYLMFLLFAGDAESCMAGVSSQLFNVLALAAGILTAPPLIYGLIRLFFWPGGESNRGILVGGSVISFGVGIFVTAAVLFAVAISEYGCG